MVPDPTPTPPLDRDLERMRELAELLDNRFRIPGTDMRFGLDGIIGLIPGVGDVAGLAVSSYLFAVMVRKGAGPLVMLRMFVNMLVDAIVGAVPLFGDLFDFGYKANRRNVQMLLRYYDSDTPKPKAGTSLALLGVFLIALFILALWGIYKLVAMLWNAGAQAF
jgi:hypothetical protein